MIRVLSLAAAVAVAVAAPAAAQSMRVPIAGKSPAQIHSDVAKAARSVCARATFGATFPHASLRACVDASVADALSRIGDPALAAKVQRLARS